MDASKTAQTVELHPQIQNSNIETPPTEQDQSFATMNDDDGYDSLFEDSSDEGAPLPSPKTTSPPLTAARRDFLPTFEEAMVMQRTTRPHLPDSAHRISAPRVQKQPPSFGITKRKAVETLDTAEVTVNPKRVKLTSENEPAATDLAETNMAGNSSDPVAEFMNFTDSSVPNLQTASTVAEDIPELQSVENTSLNPPAADIAGATHDAGVVRGILGDIIHDDPDHLSVRERFEILYQTGKHLGPDLFADYNGDGEAAPHRDTLSIFNQGSTNQHHPELKDSMGQVIRSRFTNQSFTDVDILPRSLYKFNLTGEYLDRLVQYGCRVLEDITPRVVGHQTLMKEADEVDSNGVAVTGPDGNTKKVEVVDFKKNEISIQRMILKKIDDAREKRSFGGLRPHFTLTGRKTCNYIGKEVVDGGKKTYEFNKDNVLMDTRWDLDFDRMLMRHPTTGRCEPLFALKPLRENPNKVLRHCGCPEPSPDELLVKCPLLRSYDPRNHPLTSIRDLEEKRRYDLLKMDAEAQDAEDDEDKDYKGKDVKRLERIKRKQDGPVKSYEEPKPLTEEEEVARLSRKRKAETYVTEAQPRIRKPKVDVYTLMKGEGRGARKAQRKGRNRASLSAESNATIDLTGDEGLPPVDLTQETTNRMPAARYTPPPGVAPGYPIQQQPALSLASSNLFLQPQLQFPNSGQAHQPTLLRVMPAGTYSNHQFPNSLPAQPYPQHGSFHHHPLNNDPTVTGPAPPFRPHAPNRFSQQLSSVPASTQGGYYGGSMVLPTSVAHGMYSGYPSPELRPDVTATEETVEQQNARIERNAQALQAAQHRHLVQMHQRQMAHLHNPYSPQPTNGMNGPAYNQFVAYQQQQPSVTQPTSQVQYAYSSAALNAFTSPPHI
ncbi:hypothetical protein EJ08DRAFT_692540 [Tothia fuscella]|uniref:Uncharacterized protein n=1 Tax=Tothia fuscella TaxID=1048955 RepID=A0A9P4P1U9_9PEZI|nr:hypothetical protein EJ08DRAFT_692540 [Tothia fuscella]